MACTLTATQTAACESDYGRVDDEILLLRLIAQSAATWLQAVSPGTDVSPEAVLDRACESGVGRLDDELTLLRVIAQNLCSQIT